MSDYRLEQIEKRVDRLEGLELAVVKAQVEDVKGDIKEVKDDLAAIRKILIGFLISFAFTGITTVIAILSISGAGR